MWERTIVFIFLITVLGMNILPFNLISVEASTGSVDSFQKISDIVGEFTGDLDNADRFGFSVARIGDLDNDGIEDIAVGAQLDDDGGTDAGAVWILFMGTDGKVDGIQKISDNEGSLIEDLGSGDNFGTSVAGIGDLDNDGIEDIVVGAPFDDDGNTSGNRGAVYVLFLNIDGTVKSEQKISDSVGSFSTSLADTDNFGTSVAGIGDLDNDGIEDIVVGAPGDDNDGDADNGAVYVLFLNIDGTVKSEQKISDTEGDFTGDLDDGGFFGTSVAGLVDLDGDGIEDIVVGARADDDGGPATGAVWILFLGTDGKVDGFQKISDTEGDFTGDLDDGGFFGFSVARIGDLDGDGIEDIVVGAERDSDIGTNVGAVWILFLGTDGKVDGFQKITEGVGGFTGDLDNQDRFGTSVAGLVDLDGDGVEDIVVGVPRDDDEDTDSGAVYVIFLDFDILLTENLGLLDDTVSTSTDTTAPVVTAPSDKVVISSSSTTVTYSGESATDNVDGSVTVSCTPASGSTFPVGTTIVTCTATDSSGNTGTTTFTITVTGDSSSTSSSSGNVPCTSNPNAKTQICFKISFG